MTRFERRFRKVARQLSRVQLMTSSMDAAFELNEANILDRNVGRRFLDFYGDEGIAVAFERYGIYGALRRRGYGDFALETWALDERHTLVLRGTRDGAEHRLMDLVVRRDRLTLDPPRGAPEMDRGFDVLTVDWLTLRHPTASFTDERLRLPGQDAPGLGVGERIMELLYRVVDRLSLDGLLTVAEHFHNAVLYAREMPYVDPTYRGQLAALSSLLFEDEELGFAQATWAMRWGYVIDVDDSVVRWRGEAMVKPSEAALKTYLGSEALARLTHRAQRNFRYRLRRTAFLERWESEREGLLGPPPNPDG